MLGTETGRFTASKPEMHNFNTRAPERLLLEAEDTRNYNVRDLLLSGENV